MISHPTAQRLESILSSLNQTVKRAMNVCQAEEECEHAARIECEVCGVKACRSHSRRYNDQQLCNDCAMEQGREDEFVSRYVAE